MTCSGCGRALASNHHRPVKCRFCGSVTRPTSAPTIDEPLRMLPLATAQRFGVCERCDRYDTERQTCGVLVDRGLPGRVWHPSGLPSESARCPLGYWRDCYVGTLLPDDPASVAAVTFHWNPNGFGRLAETYRQWRPTLGGLPVRCLELSIDDAPQEIPGSQRFLGNAGNVLWHKERLVNFLLQQLGPEVRYLAWLDHDLVFESPYWLRDAVAMLESGYDAIQPFSQITYLGQDGRPISRRGGAVWCLANGRPITAPGGAWIARVEWLRSIGGLFDRHIVGGADEVFFRAVTGTECEYLDRQSPALAAASREWMAGVGPTRYGYLPGGLRHLWHGDREHRQYLSRDEILRQYDFDPHAHLVINPDGILELTPAAPAGLQSAIAAYFRARRDDG